MKIQNVQIDEIDYAIRANGLLGIKETGKTYGAMWFAERLMDASIPIVAFDPSGVWPYLKVPRPEKQGYPIVVVGDNGGSDIPLSPDTAGAVMRAAMEAGVSVVFNLFSKHLSKSDWRKIVKDVCEVLLYENQDFGLRHVFLEESKEYVPQQVYDKFVFSAVEKLIRIGGNSQVGITLINQRAEGINKDVLELCASLFLFKQVGRNSITNLEKWLKKVDIENRDEITKSLFTLQKGQCWFFDEDSRSPALIQIPEKNTVHPDRRQMTGSVFAQKPVDVTAFVERLNKALKKQVKVAAARDVVAEVVTRPTKEKTASVDKPYVSELLSGIEQLKTELQQTKGELQQMKSEQSEALRRLAAVRELLEPQYKQMQVIFAELGNGHSHNANGNHAEQWQVWMEKLVGGQKTMLQVLIERRRVSKAQLSFFTGLTAGKGSTFEKYITRLVQLGLASREGNEIVLRELEQ